MRYIHCPPLATSPEIQVLRAVLFRKGSGILTLLIDEDTKQHKGKLQKPSSAFRSVNWFSLQPCGTWIHGRVNIYTAGTSNLFDTAALVAATGRSENATDFQPSYNSTCPSSFLMVVSTWFWMRTMIPAVPPSRRLTQFKWWKILDR